MSRIENVIKRDGTVEKFSPDKLNKWAEYAAEVGGNWSEIALKTFKRLNDNCSTQEIHETMIDVCIEYQSIEYSRVAARLEYAEIRKGMQYVLNFDDTASFRTILETFEDLNLWDGSTIPAYNPRWEKWFDTLKEQRFEYWQIKQWVDKYAVRIQDVVIETPAIGMLGIALSLFGDTELAFKYAQALVKGQINLPTPALNGCRNGDFDTISCCVISGSDTTESIGVAEHIAYRMTGKKAGIGIELTTRSKGDSVKGGRVKHLGKWPLYKHIDRSVKSITQITRGGNATTTALCIDPEIENIILWKSQRIDIEQRIDKLDYSFGYNDAFLEAVIGDSDWYLFSIADAPKVYDAFYTYSAQKYNKVVDEHLSRGVPHKKIKARELVKSYLTIRQETGRFYDINLTRVNTHTPFIDTIRQSNLCMEICLPTKGYEGMGELYSKRVTKGETAFCSLSAINVMRTSIEEYEEIAELALRGVDIMIDKAPMMTKSMKADIMKRRSVGIGIIGLAGHLYHNGFDYDGSESSLNEVQKVAENHYFWLLKASQKLSEEDGVEVGGIDTRWLPIDTAISKTVTDLDWESLRGKPRKHSVLVAHMPTESSSLLSSAPNGVYPIRRKVLNKKSRKGLVQYICEPFDPKVHKTAWDVGNITMTKYYSRIQDYTDQAISADYYVAMKDASKLPMSTLLKEWVAHAKLGVKTKYYLNTNDYKGGSIQQEMFKEQQLLQEEKALHPTLEVEDEDEDGCSSCKL